MTVHGRDSGISRPEQPSFSAARSWLRLVTQLLALTRLDVMNSLVVLRAGMRAELRDREEQEAERRRAERRRAMTGSADLIFSQAASWLAGTTGSQPILEYEDEAMPEMVTEQSLPIWYDPPRSYVPPGGYPTLQVQERPRNTASSSCSQASTTLPQPKAKLAPTDQPMPTWYDPPRTYSPPGVYPTPQVQEMPRNTASSSSSQAATTLPQPKAQMAPESKAAPTTNSTRSFSQRTRAAARAYWTQDPVQPPMPGQRPMAPEQQNPWSLPTDPLIRYHTLEAIADSMCCPVCGGGMRTRRNRTEGNVFLGCLLYPNCRGTRRLPFEGC